MDLNLEQKIFNLAVVYQKVAYDLHDWWIVVVVVAAAAVAVVTIIVESSVAIVDAGVNRSVRRAAKATEATNAPTTNPLQHDE